MKKIFTRLMMLCLFGMISMGASAYDFFAVNAEGVTLYYNIVSETDLTCEVTNSGNDEIKYSGDIIIPSTANYLSKTFTVVGLGSGAFKDCVDLFSVELPNTLTYLGFGTFWGCIKLKSLKIPQSLESIENCSFNDVNHIESIYITDLNKWAQINFIPNASWPISRKTKLYLNGRLVTDLTQLSVKEIARWAFRNYQYFESITIPNSVERIGDEAFSECSGLTGVTIPNSVIEIEDRAFYGCGNLNVIHVDWDEPINVPENIVSSWNVTLVVPAGTKEKYMAADVWKNFFGIVELNKLVNNITLDKESAIISPGESFRLNPTYSPLDASVQIVGWTSSDPSVATVDKHGNVRGVHKGKATITAKTLDGSNITKSCEVTVRRGDVHVEGNSIYAKISTLTSGTQMILPIYMTNDWNSICSFQFDIEIPDGFSIATAGSREPTYKIEKSAERFAGLDHIISSNLQSDGTIRVLCSSLTNSNIRRTNDVGKDIGDLPILYIRDSRKLSEINLTI